MFLREHIDSSMTAKEKRRLYNLKWHLENQFKTDMSWENYGKWEIDHIVPLSSAKTEEELYSLCRYTNLQPLWKTDNIKKGGYYQASKS